VEGALEELPGILEARVDLKTKDVYIKYRPAQVTQEAMQHAVERVDLRLRARHWLHRWMLWLRRGSDHGA
jgi:copper chaperone CopZ